MKTIPNQNRKEINSKKSLKFEIEAKRRRKVKASKKEEKLDKINKKYWFGLSIEWKQNDVMKP